MDIATLISNAYRQATGENDDTVTPNNEDGITLLQIANQKVNEYYNTIDDNGELVLWRNMYDPEYEVDTISTDRFYRIPSDKVFAIGSGLNESVQLIDPDGEQPPIIYRLAHISDVNSANGTWPKTSAPKVCTLTMSGLTFPFEFEDTDPEFGRTILAPIYRRGAALDSNTTDIAKTTGIANPYWLVAAVAAEYARNDVLKQGQYANILAQANNLMRQMIELNNSTQYLQDVNTPDVYGLNYGGMVG